MQLQGWGLTRASGIVIILVVVQHFGLGQILAFAPSTTAVLSPAESSQAIAALDTVVPLAALIDASCRSSAALGEHGSRTTLPDPAPLPRRLPRAPPAV
jgi:hypothetical protein